MLSTIWIPWNRKEIMMRLFIFIMCVYLSFNLQLALAGEISTEDLEIINNLALLENIELLKEEDVAFLEEYEYVEGIEENGKIENEGKDDE